MAPFAKFVGPDSFFLSYGGLFSGTLFLCIPLFALLLLFARRFTRFRLNPEWNRNLWMIWGISAVIFIASAISTASQFQTDASTTTIVEHKINDKTIRISSFSNNKGNSILNLDGLKLSRRSLISDNISVRVAKSNSDLIEIRQNIRSQGLHHEDALAKANQVKHKIKVNGNEILIPEFYELKSGSKFRGQRIEYEILIPEGKEVEFDKSVRHLYTRITKDENYDSPHRIYGNQWTMKESGFVAQKWLDINSFEKQFDFKDFNRLNIEGDFKTTITYGDKYSVRVVGNKENSESLDIVQNSQTLSITGSVDYSNALKLFVTLPKLESIHLIETNAIRIEGFNQEKLELVKNGRFDVKTYVDVKELTLDLKGTGLVTLIGNGEHLNLRMNDYSKLDAERFLAKTATLKGHRYKRSYINVTEKLEYDNSHSLNMEIFGDPIIAAMEKEN